MIDDSGAVSRGWLSGVLSDALAAPHLSVSAMRAQVLSTHAAHCAQLFRLHIDYAIGAPHAPRTLIAKVPRCFNSSSDRTSGLASFLLEDLGEIEASPQVVGMGDSDAALALIGRVRTLPRSVRPARRR